MIDALEPCPDCGSIHHKACTSAALLEAAGDLLQKATECEAKAGREMARALNGDASLALEVSGLKAIAWHLEKGFDNGKISRDALAKALRSVANKLERCSQIIEDEM